MSSIHVSKADFQNRRKEEELMWKARQNFINVNGKRKFNEIDDRRSSDEQNYDDQQQSGSKSKTKPNNKWMKKLMNVESKQPERWGHDGYKELYPEEFSSSSDDESLNVKNSKKPKKSKKKKAKILEKSKKKKRKRKSSRKKKKNKTK
ncbi:hypothetical protein BLA29_009796 [Euroglyphus maynei]|uniref:Uncharacterized protein n=1 Tax=Euroglyphus maynei TaxID=6958 RepID=A0A1Y3BIS2_EURMA|nr:hypothetical protein BLA29_009796 [Euroglyphus maynei]